MDGTRFDRLTQELGHALTRRRFGALVGALGLWSGRDTANGVKAKPKKKKKKPCGRGAIRCGAKCVNPLLDARNCGKCGRACGAGQACVTGSCQDGGCPGSQISCGGRCVDPRTDSDHCGDCGNSCNGTCAGGTCQAGGCPSGQDVCNGQCVDKQTDNRHCGACGDACTVGRCIAGRCVECVNQDDCGGYSYNDLICRNGRCVCATEGEGLCQRYSDRRGSCDKCCPGGSGQCRFDEVCFYVQGPNGPYGFCDCPTGWQRCNYQPHPSGTCVENPMTDSRKCGPFCEDCTATPEWSPKQICCNGGCISGCGGPGTSSCVRGQICGPNCLPCNSDSICCNMGPGTLPRCIPDAYGGTCYLN